MPKRRVLVVEDDSDVATTTAEMLRILGHTATVAVTLESALEIWKEENHAFDLAIVDCVLGNGSGALLATRFLTEKPTLAIILTSGLTEDNIDTPPAHARFLPKPYSVTQLREAIDASP